MLFLAVNSIKPNTSPPGDAIAEHVAWVRDGIASGTVLQAGRWGDTRGVIVIRARDAAHAQSILHRDPIVRLGIVDLEIAPFHPDVTDVRFTTDTP